MFDPKRPALLTTAALSATVLSATVLSATLLGSSLLMATGAAAAVPAGTVSPFTASAGASLLHVQALTGVPAADLELGPATASSDGTTSKADGANLDALALGTLSLSGILTDVSQTSSPGVTQAPATGQLLGVPAAPVATAGVGTGSAAATDIGGGVCPSADTPVSDGESAVAGASVLPALPTLGDALDVAQTVHSTGNTALLASTGQDGLAVASTATSDLTSLTLLGGTVTVSIAHQPTLTALATGTPGTSTVTYSAPVVTVTIAGQTQTLSAPGQGVTIPGLGTLSLGTLTETVAADGTSATGSVSLLHLDISPAGTELATVDLAPETASSTAPAGGVLCGASVGTGDPIPTSPVTTAAPSPSAPNAQTPFSAFEKGVSGATVNPGASFSSPLILSNTAACTITDAMVTDVVKGDLTLESSSPAASASDGSYTYGPFTLAPGQVITVAQTFGVPADAKTGTTYGDTATVSGTCDGTATTGTSAISGPTVDAVGTGACDLQRSRLTADHTQVTPGEDFDDVIDLLNTGGADCTDVTAIETLPAGTSFVSCTGGCTVSGDTISWPVGTLAPGASRDLTLTVAAPAGPADGHALAAVAKVTAHGIGAVKLATTVPALTGTSELRPLLPASRGPAKPASVTRKSSAAKKTLPTQPTEVLAYTGMPPVAFPALLLLLAAGAAFVIRRRLAHPRG